MTKGLWSRGRVSVFASFVALLTVGLPAQLPDATVPVGAASRVITASIGSGSVVVSPKGDHAILFPVTLSQRATSTVSVSFATHPGSAKPGRSYQSKSGTLKFAVNKRTGTTSLLKFITIIVHPSTATGPTRLFSVRLTSPVGATLGNPLGLGTIFARPAGNEIRVSAGGMQVFGGTGGGTRLARIHVVLSRAATRSIMVHYSLGGGNAVAGRNYVAPRTGTLKIPKGRLGAWLNVGVVSGSVSGAPKRVNFKITSASGLAVTRAAAIVTIMPEPGDNGSPGGGGGGGGGGSQPPPGNYIFDDEFNGNSLDLSKWQPNWLGNNNSSITKPINGSEESCYDPAQVSVSGGSLHLDAAKRSCRASNGSTYSSASGLVESMPHFTFAHGYMEARIWLDGGSSTANWPAFWADGTGTWPSTGELDVFEGLHGRDCYHFHSNSGGPGGCANLGSPAGWHTFGAKWESGLVTFFYDGNQVGTISNGITNAPMYLILNLAVGGEGGPNVLPSTMLVDYVRVTS